MRLKLQSIAWLIAAAFLITGGAPAAYAQTSGTPAAQKKAPANNSTASQQNSATKIPQKPLSLNDKAFVDSAAQDAMLEITLAKQAEAKTSSPDVKSFAHKIIEDRTKSNQQLKQIAQKEGFQLPDTLSISGQRELNRLSKLSGLQFDKAYLRFAIEDHQNAITTFESEAKQGTGPSLKTFATNTAPTLKEHLSMAQSVNRKFASESSTKRPWWEFWKKG